MVGEAAGISQRELAAYVGVSKSTVCRVEHGERALLDSERIAISRALGVSLAHLTASPTSSGNARAAA